MNYLSDNETDDTKFQVPTIGEIAVVLPFIVAIYVLWCVTI